MLGHWQNEGLAHDGARVARADVIPMPVISSQIIPTLPRRATPEASFFSASTSRHAFHVVAFGGGSRGGPLGIVFLNFATMICGAICEVSPSDMAGVVGVSSAQTLLSLGVLSHHVVHANFRSLSGSRMLESWSGKIVLFGWSIGSL